MRAVATGPGRSCRDSRPFSPLSPNGIRRPRPNSGWPPPTGPSARARVPGPWCRRPMPMATSGKPQRPTAGCSPRPATLTSPGLSPRSVSSLPGSIVGSATGKGLASSSIGCSLIPAGETPSRLRCWPPRCSRGRPQLRPVRVTRPQPTGYSTKPWWETRRQASGVGLRSPTGSNDKGSRLQTSAPPPPGARSSRPDCSSWSVWWDGPGCRARPQTPVRSG